MSGSVFAFAAGAVAAGYAVVTLLFLKFWARMRDWLFLAFALAFLLLAVDLLLATLLESSLESRPWTYLFRLAAFCVLIAAIIGKSLSTPSGRQRGGGG